MNDVIEASERQAAAKRSTLVSVVVNLLLTGLQVAAGLIFGSQGLIADGIHSLSDLLADFVVLVANHFSGRAPDEDHHYGHMRYETAASLVLGILLVVVGVGILWSSIGKLQHPERIAQVHILALWVALGALAAKEALFRYMLAVGLRVGSTMLVANAWHARSDAASSLVVGVGIVGNLLGLPLFDPIAALVVGIMIGRMGWSFSWQALGDLMDRSASEEQHALIREALAATPGVLGFHDLRSRKMGDQILLDVHLEVREDLSVREGHDITVEARRRIREVVPVLNVMTHLDPVEASRADAGLGYSASE